MSVASVTGSLTQQEHTLNAATTAAVAAMRTIRLSCSFERGARRTSRSTRTRAPVRSTTCRAASVAAGKRIDMRLPLSFIVVDCSQFSELNAAFITANVLADAS